MVKCNENAIREAAYFIWQNAGCPQGQDEKFWAMAVEQINGCGSSCCKKSSASKSASCKSSASCKASSEKKKVATKKTVKK